MKKSSFWKYGLVVISIVAILLFACGDNNGSSGSNTSGEGNGTGNGGGENSVAVTAVMLNKATLSIAIGGTETLTAAVAPENATNKAVTWTIDDDTVATVSNGTVTAVKVGSAIITVKTTDGNKTATCAVTVTRAQYEPNATDKTTNIGKLGPGGGTIFYVSASGFTVTGTGSFTAYYLEAAPINQATSFPWCAHDGSCLPNTDTAIGTGKANTAAILANGFHIIDDGNNAAAARVCANITIGGKTDWFLPSKDELNEMYKARTHLEISEGRFWSSSQYVSYGTSGNAWGKDFADGSESTASKVFGRLDVRAIRAF